MVMVSLLRSRERVFGFFMCFSLVNSFIHIQPFLYMKSYKFNLSFVTILTALICSSCFLYAEEKKPPFDEVFKKLDTEVRAALKKRPD